MMISRPHRAARSCLLLAALVAGPAAALQRLNFDQFSGEGISISPPDAVIIDDFSFTAVGRPGFDIVAIDGSASQVGLPMRVGFESPRLYAVNDAEVLVASTSGNPINLLSVDFGGSWLDTPTRWADAIEVTGYRGDVIVGQTVLDLDPTVPTPSLTTISFDSQFRDLTRISFHGLGDTGLGRNNHEFTLDNLVVSHAPEPETYALLLAGLGLLSWRLRRAAAKDAQASCADYARTQSTK